MRLIPGLILACAIGSGCTCATNVVPLDARVDADAAPAPIDASLDAPDAPDDVGPFPPEPRCELRAAGTEPFSIRLEGSGLYAGGSPGAMAFGFHSESVNVFFPAGRVAGAPVIVTHPISWPWPGLAEWRGVVADDGSVPAIALGGSFGLQDFHIAGELVAPDDGMRAMLRRNFASPSTDVAEEGLADFPLCPIAGERPPAARFVTEAFGPLSAVRIASSVPLDAASEVRVEAGARALSTRVDLGTIELRAVEAFAPGAAVTFTLDARDVLGRAIVVGGDAPVALATTATLSDLTFTAPVEEGSIAVAGDDWFHDDAAGVVRFGAVDGLRIRSNPFSALLAIGEAPSGAARVRIDQQLWCGSSLESRAALLTLDGTASEIVIACDDAPRSIVVDIPGPGPLFVAFEHASIADRPQWLSISTVEQWTVDAISFE